MVIFIVKIFIFFRTKKQLESHKKVCENKDFGEVVMPAKDTKTIKFNQHLKYEGSSHYFGRL